MTDSIKISSTIGQLGMWSAAVHCSAAIKQQCPWILPTLNDAKVLFKQDSKIVTIFEIWQST